MQDILGYSDKFNVLAFPSNQFGEQEPYEDEAIYSFAVTNYDVEFPMFSKIDVIGENAHPAFQNLISQFNFWYMKWIKYNTILLIEGQSSVHPDWNFYKYLVNENGTVLKVWSTKTTIEEIFDHIKDAIDALTEAKPSDPVTDSIPSDPTKDEL